MWEPAIVRGPGMLVIVYPLSRSARPGPRRIVTRTIAPFPAHQIPSSTGIMPTGLEKRMKRKIPMAIRAAPLASVTQLHRRRLRPNFTSPRSTPPAKSCAASLNAGSFSVPPDKTACRTCQRCTAGRLCRSMSHLSTGSVGGPRPPACCGGCFRLRVSHHAVTGRPTPMTTIKASAHAMTTCSLPRTGRSINRHNERCRRFCCQITPGRPTSGMTTASQTMISRLKGGPLSHIAMPAPSRAHSTAPVHTSSENCQMLSRSSQPFTCSSCRRVPYSGNRPCPHLASARHGTRPVSMPEWHGGRDS
jgi:hypothetical protein